MSLQAELLATLLAGSSGLLWLGIRHFRKQSSTITEPCTEHEESPAQQDTPDAHEQTFQAPDSVNVQEHKVGVRVELHGLQKAAELNGSFGVVLSYDADSCRYGVRKEMALAGENTTLTVKASSLRAAPRLDTLAALQELVGSAPEGARVMLARGTITAEKEEASSNHAGGASDWGRGGGGGGGASWEERDENRYGTGLHAAFRRRELGLDAARIAASLKACGGGQTLQTRLGMYLSRCLVFSSRLLPPEGHAQSQSISGPDLAKALLDAGASHLRPSGVEGAGDSARALALRLRSFGVIKVFQQHELAQGLPLPDGEIEL